MTYLLYLHTEANSTFIELAHANGSSYPLNGCTSAEPFYVSLDLVNVAKNLIDTV